MSVVSSFGQQRVTGFIARLAHMQASNITLQNELVAFRKVLCQYKDTLTPEHADGLIDIQLAPFDVQSSDEAFFIRRGNAGIMIPIIEDLVAERPDLISARHLVALIDAVAFESLSCLKGCNLKPLVNKMALQPNLVFSGEVLSRLDRLKANQPEKHARWVDELYASLEKRDARVLGELPRLFTRRINS